jgi:hypothetical protein
LINSTKNKNLNTKFIKLYFDNLEFKNKLKNELYDFKIRSELFDKYRFYDYSNILTNNEFLDIEKITSYFSPYLINKKINNNNLQIKDFFPEKNKNFYTSYSFNKLLNFFSKNIKNYRRET